MTTLRTQAEILERIDAIKEEDYFGFRQEVLLYALTFENARPFLKDTTTEANWKPTLTFEDVETEALLYLAFALSKALGHRGISASRSVEKMSEFAWLLGRDDVYSVLEETEYAPYGAPILKAWAVTYGEKAQAVVAAELAEDDEGELARMLDGQRCEDGCGECFG